jgi:hypothetical protein
VYGEKFQEQEPEKNKKIDEKGDITPLMDDNKDLENVPHKKIKIQE